MASSSSSKGKSVRVLPLRSVKAKSPGFQSLLENKYDYDNFSESSFLPSNSRQKASVPPIIEKTVQSYQCVICQSNFANGNTLREHIVYQHTEDGKILYQQKLSKQRKKKIDSRSRLLVNSSKVDTKSVATPVKRVPSLPVKRLPHSQQQSNDISKKPNNQSKSTLQSVPKSQWNCELCKRFFIKKSNLQLHIQRVHPSEEEEMKKLDADDSTKKKFESKNNNIGKADTNTVVTRKNNNSRTRGHPNSTKPVPFKMIKTKNSVRCGYCQRQFKRAPDVRKHWKRVHDPEGRENARLYAIQYWENKKKQCQKISVKVKASKDNLKLANKCFKIMELQHQANMRRRNNEKKADSESVENIATVLSSKAKESGKNKITTTIESVPYTVLESKGSSPKYMCDTCHKEYSSQKAVKRHWNEVHDPAGREKVRLYSIQYWEKKKKQRQNSIDIKRTQSRIDHSNPKDSELLLCPVPYQMDEKEQEGEDLECYYCPTCYRLFKSEESLENHCNRVHNNAVKLFLRRWREKKGKVEAEENLKEDYPQKISQPPSVISFIKKEQTLEESNDQCHLIDQKLFPPLHPVILESVKSEQRETVHDGLNSYDLLYAGDNDVVMTEEILCADALICEKEGEEEISILGIRVDDDDDDQIPMDLSTQDSDLIIKESQPDGIVEDKKVLIIPGVSLGQSPKVLLKSGSILIPRPLQ